jgi:hypothetical protein
MRDLKRNSERPWALVSVGFIFLMENISSNLGKGKFFKGIDFLTRRFIFFTELFLFGSTLRCSFYFISF